MSKDNSNWGYLNIDCTFIDVTKYSVQYAQSSAYWLVLSLSFYFIFFIMSNR